MGDMIQHDCELLRLVCSNVSLPRCSRCDSKEAPIAGIADVGVGLLQGDIAHTLDSPFQDNDDRIDASTERNSDISGKQHADTNRSDMLGPGHAKSESSDRSHAEKTPTAQANIGGHLERKSSSCDAVCSNPDPETMPAPYIKGPPGLDSTMPRFGLSLESGASSAIPGASAASSSTTPATGPRRKTRRGKTGHKNQHWERDQMSIPDTHNSWD